MFSGACERGEFSPEVLKSPSPVAQTVFLFRLQLREGPAGGGLYENRVVAESSSSRFVEGDVPRTDSFGVKERLGLD